MQFLFACVRLHPLAWLHGKASFLRLLPRLRGWRRAAQAARVVPDRELLVGGPLTLNPGLADHGPKRWLHTGLDAVFRSYFKLFGRLCG